MIANCDQCPLNGRTKVQGVGALNEESKVSECEDEQYDIMIVGMEPGTEEIHRGKPFVGPSGRFLRKTLHQLDIKKYYCTNLLQCPVQKESDDVALADACCRPRLLAEIKKVQPKVIITLGDRPMRAFLDTEFTVTELAGGLTVSNKDTDKTLILPLMHPAYYLRRPDEAFDFVEGMRAGIRVLEGVYEHAQDATYTIVTDDNYKQVLEKLEQFEHIAVDTETTGFFATGIKDKAVMLEMGLAVEAGHAYIVPRENVHWFKDLLERKKCLFWHARFDASFLLAEGIHPNVYFDGMLAHYAMDERPHSHGLKRVARIYLGAEDWEKDINVYLKNKKTDSYAIIPTDVRYQYLSYDATRTWQLWKVLGAEVKDNWVFWNIIMPGTRMFIDIEHRGIPIDPNKVLEMHTYLGEVSDRCLKELCEIAEKDINPNSPKQVAEILYDKLQLPMDPRFGRSTNKNLLEMYRDDIPFVDKLIEYREATHDRGNYIKGFVERMDSNFRVHPAIKMFGTVTGRLASENPSIMNIKSKSRVKELFIPEPGKVLLHFDFKQAELRWYCIYANDTKLQKILDEGYDQDFGIELTENERKDPHFVIGMVAYKDREKAVAKRVVTKSMVFGKLYGRGRKSFIDGGNKARRGVLGDNAKKEEVDFLLNVINYSFPGLNEYSKSMIDHAMNFGYVESFFGRRRRFPLITRDNKGEVERQATNMPIQSASSDLNLLCMLHLWSLKDELDIRPMFSVHDSITVSAPSPDLLPVLKKEIENKAKEVSKGQINFPVDAAWGENWGTLHKYE